MAERGKRGAAASRQEHAWLGKAARVMAVGGVAVVAGLGVAAALRVLAEEARVRGAAREGREISARAAAEAKAQGAAGQLTTFRRNGASGDPLNLRVIGADEQLGAAFASAGWYRADETTLMTAVRICADSVFDRKYSSAPVSNLYLYGRSEDYAFEHPGASVRERDHARFWNTGQREGGRPVWVGAATRDVKVALSRETHLPTHGIAPDVDTERNLVADDLMSAGWVTDEEWAPGFGRPTQQVNGDGFPYTTDGRVAVLTLAEMSVPAVFTQVRGPLLAAITQRLAPLWRPALSEHALQRMRARLASKRHPATGGAGAGGASTATMGTAGGKQDGR